MADSLLFPDRGFSINGRYCEGNQSFADDKVRYCVNRKTGLSSRPLKTIFQREVCKSEVHADFSYKPQKNSHSSFEVICGRS